MSFGTLKTTATALLLVAGLLSPAVAQAPLPGILNPDARSRWLQAVEDSASRDAAAKDEIVKANADKRQREFNLLLADFANNWNKLIQVAGKGGWSAKEARKTRQAFERLVRSEAWIEEAKAAAAKSK